MKTQSFACTAFLLFSSCFTETASKKCNKVTEVPVTTEHLVDVSGIMKNDQVRTILEVNKGSIQVYRIFENETSYGNITVIYCNSFYKGFQLLNDPLIMYLQNNSLQVTGSPPPGNINLEFKPTIMVNEAVRVAREKTDFENNCIGFRLGIRRVIDFNDSVPSYRLAWLLEDITDGSPNIMVDAHTGQQL